MKNPFYKYFTQEQLDHIEAENERFDSEWWFIWSFTGFWDEISASGPKNLSGLGWRGAGNYPSPSTQAMMVTCPRDTIEG